MSAVSSWTGRTACALQAAMRHTNEAFAEHLGVGVRTVASWHQKPDVKPRTDIQQVLDAGLDQASEDVRRRFAQLVDRAQSPAQHRQADERLTADPHVVAALDWLDQQAGWPVGAARAKVSARLDEVSDADLRDRSGRRERVDQRALSRALAEYYGTKAGYGRYGLSSGSTRVATTILTRPDWLDLACPLDPEHDHLQVVPTTSGHQPLAQTIADRAVQRLAETVATGTRMVNMPVYRLQAIEVRREKVGGSVDVAPFVEYALTMDMLEGELVDAVIGGKAVERGALPLRDAWLPTIDKVLNVSDRLCAGGTLALCAVARPAEFGREPDYLLLVQERSGHVVNAARKLAVIPKAFHQPLTDVRVDAQIGRTLRRELEEELFGREEIDNTVGVQRSADPLHPARLSEPMRWLSERPGRLRLECTGFGLNLVSGNYEFPGLIVIDDEEFWPRFGGLVEANWETSSLRQYSSQDAELLGELLADVAWSNEGLFALAQGLRRLSEIGGHRVNLPNIVWEVLE